VPPPVYFVAGFGTGAVLHWLWPLGLPDLLFFDVLGWMLIGAALSLLISAVWLFRAAGTNMLPYRPPTVFVSRGPYRFSRNPMYLALALLYAGLSLALSMLWPLLVLPAVLGIIQVAVIRSEEQHLLRCFGEEYRNYNRRVRRWI
jgi:protein-S-isoprenylcysteine O-methyltransferase Ste14